jgi:drug/metabolite transporter (DMT)-like permease
MVGAAIYFVLSAADDTGLPPIVLAAGGLVVGAVALVVAGAVGMVPMAASTAPVTYRDATVPWWVPLALVGLVACALAYCAGIAASRRLGPRLASFVALFEVVAALGFAWLLLAELPRPVQLLGGLLVLAGVITVKSGEPRNATSRNTTSRNTTLRDAQAGARADVGAASAAAGSTTGGLKIAGSAAEGLATTGA